MALLGMGHPIFCKIPWKFEKEAFLPLRARIYVFRRVRPYRVPP